MLEFKTVSVKQRGTGRSPSAGVWFDSALAGIGVSTDRAPIRSELIFFPLRSRWGPPMPDPASAAN
jgi:hypothetical protein